MREINDIETFIDDEFHDIINDEEEMADVEVQNSASTDYLLNVNGRSNKNNNRNDNDDDKVISNETDSGIIYDPEERNCSELSISDKTTQSGRVDSGIDSISKIPSIREFKNFKSLSKSSIKSSSVSTVAVPMREQQAIKSSHKLRSKRYSLPDIDKLKAYNDVKQCTKRQNQRKTELFCDMQNETQIPLVPTETKPLDALSGNKDKIDTFFIDPKLINKFDGLSQSLYYVDENGSPKIRERYIKQQRLLIEKQEQKKREKAARKSLESEASCSCFNFSRLSKKIKELCKFWILPLSLLSSWSHE